LRPAEHAVRQWGDDRRLSSLSADMIREIGASQV
jgi:hypothetical protein